MRSKLHLLCVVLSFLITLIACSKNGDTPPAFVPSTQPDDSANPGWKRIKPAGAGHLYDVFFVNNRIGFVCGDNYLAKSVDSGFNWMQTIPDSLKQNFTNLFFIDNNTGWATGESFLLRTTDAGTTWKKINNGLFFDVYFFDEKNGFLSTLDQGLFKTTDGGITLQKVSGEHPTGLFFLNKEKGWFYGEHIFSTVNGGLSFSSTSSQQFDNIYAMQFTDDTHGWLAGNGIYHTTDGGATFDKLFAAGLGDIQFFDNDNGYILCSDSMYLTKDAGKTNTLLLHAPGYTLFELHFTDPDHGWVTGYSGYVYRYVKP